MQRLDPNVGDVCRVGGEDGLWVPFSPAQRTDGSSYKTWWFVRYPEANARRVFDLDWVDEIVSPHSDPENIAFWQRNFGDTD